MAKARKTSTSNTTAGPVEDYRYRTSKRKNNPPAAMASAAPVPVIAKARYEYNPHLPPVLRFDQTAKSDVLETRLSAAAEARVTELLNFSATRALTAAEREECANLIGQAAHARVAAEPWLEWSGKRETKWFEVDPVALHIHERISTQAILKVAAREDVERSLFGDPQQAYHEAVQFYKHDIDWANRLILGDSLSVMSSLAKREDLAGKVQMIYIDPPYGIKFASNFQPEIGRRDVKDKESDLTREPEMVKAYRDTWNLGIHSYLSYLRDRLVAAKELLADTGSIFVQISDENVHLVRQVMVEVFGTGNFVSEIAVKKTTSSSGDRLSSVYDILLWFCKESQSLKYRQLYSSKIAGGEGASQYSWIESRDGRRWSSSVDVDSDLIKDARIFRADVTTSQRPAQGGDLKQFEVNGQEFEPGKGTFKTDLNGLTHLRRAERLFGIGKTLCYVRFIDDFPAYPLSNMWENTTTSGFADQKRYVVQTSPEIVKRCLLMTTDPGDLVFDPTCGSGTTAYVAEQWGRRWITCDTSRVALSIARQRLLTAKFDYYRTKHAPGTSPTDPNGNPAKGFLYKTVPHITLKSIAQNVALDPIFAKHEPILEEKLKAANAALAKVSAELRHRLEMKLLAKQKTDGKKAITDADRRRWLLPPENRDRGAEAKKRAMVDLEAKHWYAWEVPFDTDPDWPKALADAVTEYRKAWRAKMDEVNACIAASAESEELVDQPEVVRGVTRVSGPFTVEAVQPPEMSLGDLAGTIEFEGAPDEVGPTFAIKPVVSGVGHTPQDIAAYLDKMIKLLKLDGVRFPNNKQMTFSRLEPIYDSRQGKGTFHAEGRWVNSGDVDSEPDGDATVGVIIGPQYGPVTAAMIDNIIKPASRRYDDLVVAAFSFDAAAVAILTEDPLEKLRLHIAHIRPDVNPAMDGLLKDSPGGQLFTVFGLPRIGLSPPDADGMYQVTMEGVDIYDPVANTIQSSGADKVAAWFLDGDYDGRTFCVTQAFFPDRNAWDKLARALGGAINPEKFEALSGTTSLPFAPGKHKRIAVKVIDPRGNEVMTVQQIEGD